MDIVLILLAALAATTLYAITNYFLSSRYRSHAALETDLSAARFAPVMKDIEWFLIHYLFGLLFVSGYYFFWISQSNGISWTSGIVFGAIIGGIGMIARSILFKVFDKSVPANPVRYYSCFFTTQMVFGLTTVLIYQILP